MVPLGALLGARLGPCLILLNPDVPRPCSGSATIGLLNSSSRSLIDPPSIEKRMRELCIFESLVSDSARVMGVMDRPRARLPVERFLGREMG